MSVWMVYHPLVEEKLFVRTKSDHSVVPAHREHQAMPMLELVCLSNFNVNLTDNVGRTKNVAVENVSACLHSSLTTEMETDAEAHVINLDADLTLNVLPQIHHNVYAKQDLLETH